MREPTVGLALIAKDEEKNLPHLLASIEGAFDRVVLLDTGSTDDTVKVFQEWAKDQPGATFSVGSYEWCDDFADARNAADRLLTFGSADFPPVVTGEPLVDWKVWADCDDEIIGADRIRQIILNLPPHVVGLVAFYDYAQDPNTGHNIIMLKRERIVRVGAGVWDGRVHEAQNLHGGAVTIIPAGELIWRHRKLINSESLEEANDSAFGSNDRNLRILSKWHEEDPTNPRVVAYLGVETATRGDHAEAITFYDKYLALHTSWDEERAQVLRRKGNSLMALERPDEAVAAAFEALAVLPSWPDSYLTLAQAYMEKGEWAKALTWAEKCFDIGAPSDTLLIINPLDYSFLPLKLMAMAHGEMGDNNKAIEIGSRAHAVYPGDLHLAIAMHGWMTHRKREKTAETFSMCAQQLIAHDEQLKALALLHNVPYFAYDHPGIVHLRSELRERIMWAHDPDAYAEHYETGGSKPEDFMDNERAAEVCAQLPRCNFLLDGILDQIESNA